MQYKSVDVQCKQCKNKWEIWLEDGKIDAEEKCLQCGASAEMLEQQLSVSHKHVSWSMWNPGV